jgi:hypothetical protein
MIHINMDNTIQVNYSKNSIDDNISEKINFLASLIDNNDIGKKELYTTSLLDNIDNKSKYKYLKYKNKYLLLKKNIS